MRLPGWPFLIPLLAAGALCQAPSPSPWTGFSAPAIDGARFAIHTADHAPTLFGFLAMTRSVPQADSRSTAVILQSLDHQYAAKGLRVAAMDASAAVSGQPSRHDDVVNTAADWNLRFPVLEDPDGSRGRAFHLRGLPTLVLLAADGTEVGRWVGYTRTAVLAQAIERQLGGPLGPLPDAAASPGQSSKKR
jgi:hypothetical protein